MIADSYRGHSQSMSDWSRIHRRRESEFIGDSGAKRFQNWLRGEEWMQIVTRRLFSSVLLQNRRSNHVSRLPCSNTSDPCRSKLLNGRQLDNSHGLFLIAAQEDHVSRRASHDVFMVIGQEAVKPQASPVNFRRHRSIVPQCRPAIVSPNV
jgi:hypothetical protein